jgi:hypothetical protein
MQDVLPVIHSYQHSMNTNVLTNARVINTQWIMRYGDFRQVTACGKAVMKQAMTQHGVLTLERLLVQELPCNELPSTQHHWEHC